MIKFEDIVELKTFQGLIEAPKGTSDNENYWCLIGAKGKVVSTNAKGHPAFPEKGKRVLVQFVDDVKLQGLSCHNDVDNSLWIFLSDLEQKEVCDK